MDPDDERLMDEYRITAETKLVFHYDGRRYERLADAVNYARTQRAEPNSHDASRGSTDKHG